MDISREELREYNKNGRDSGLGMLKWVEQYRKKTVALPVKTEREEIMEILDAEGVEYKKNASTESLKKLLGDN